MTNEVIDFVVVDTNIVAYLTKSSPWSDVYTGLIGDRRIAFSFATIAELLSAGYEGLRAERLQALLAGCVTSPQSEATLTWFSLAVEKRNELGYKGSVGDNDLWILAAAGEHQVPLVTHDTRQRDIARALGVEVLTALPD